MLFFSQKRQIPYDCTCMWKYKEKYRQTNKTETDSLIQKTDWWLPEGREVGDWVKKVKGLRSTD